MTSYSPDIMNGIQSAEYVWCGLESSCFDIHENDFPIGYSQEE